MDSDRSLLCAAEWTLTPFRFNLTSPQGGTYDFSIYDPTHARIHICESGQIGALQRPLWSRKLSLGIDPPSFCSGRAEITTTPRGARLGCGNPYLEPLHQPTAKYDPNLLCCHSRKKKKNSNDISGPKLPVSTSLRAQRCQRRGGTAGVYLHHAWRPVAWWAGRSAARSGPSCWLPSPRRAGAPWCN